MHQYLFYIGDFPVRTYGLVLSLSIILATGVGYFFAKQDGHGYEKHIVDIGIYGGIAGLLGARLWDVFFFDWEYYQNHLTEILNVWQGGMAVQGGLLLGALTGIWYSRAHKLDTLLLADLLAPAMILGQALGRCANLLNGDAFGAPTGSTYGIVYPDTTLAHHTYGSQPLWPAEVWEGQLDIVIFALLLIFRSTNHAKGQCFALYVMLYSLARFLLEYLRGDYTHLIFGLFKSAQLTSLAAFTIAALAFLLLQFQKSRRAARPQENRNSSAKP
ncbi:MAG: prolipoprotein diacylglyceryl transferase [Selenomonadaceae bacterium]|nr:prolipoprotein diacylglyceryl transferase [Selenomonadaceae bacterium]